MPSDKSGKLCVTTPDAYDAMGQVHIMDDKEVDLDEARSLTSRYVQRSPTVPIKVNEMMI